MEVLGVRIDAQGFSDAIDTLYSWTQSAERRYVSMCSVYTLMSAAEQPEVHAALDSASMVAADGMPIVWVQRSRGYATAQRVYGPDVLRAMCQRSAGQAVRHYFYGGLPGVADTLAVVLQNSYPGLQVAGSYAPPVEPFQAKIDPDIVAQLNDSDAHVIWVGLGSPKQDLWMELYRPVLKAPILIGVGAAFDFVSGNKRHAPLWMQTNGLEWAFRLAHEPRRLWRRYLIYNPRFVMAMLRQVRQRSNVVGHLPPL